MLQDGPAFGMNQRNQDQAFIAIWAEGFTCVWMYHIWTDQPYEPIFQATTPKASTGTPWRVAHQN